MKNLCALSFVVALAWLPPCASAQTQKVRPGLWEYSFTMKSPGGQAESATKQMQQAMASMPPEQRKKMEEMMAKQGVAMGAGGSTIKTCVSKEQAEQDALPQREGCTQTVSRSGNTMQVNFQCKGPPPSSGQGKVTFSSETAYTGEFSVQTLVNGKPETTQMSQAGTWKSADCGTLKPLAKP